MEKIKLNDFLEYNNISCLQISPGGEYYGFMVTTVNYEGNCYDSNIWIYSKKEEKYSQLTDCNDQSDFIWMDGEHIIFKTTQLDKKLLNYGVKKTTAVYKKIHVVTKETEDFIKLSINPFKIKRIDDKNYLLTYEHDHLAPDFNEPNEEALKNKIREYNISNGYKVLDELPTCANGDGIINKVRRSIAVYNLEKGELEKISDAFEDVNLVTIKDRKILYSAFPFQDIKKITEGLYLYDLETKEKKTLIADDLYSIDYADFFEDGIICLALEMTTYGVYEHPCFFRLDYKGHKELLTRYDLRVSGSIGTDSYSGNTSQQRVYKDHLYFVNTENTEACLISYCPKEGFQKIIGGSGAIKDFDLCDDEIVYIAFRDLNLPELYSFENGKEKRISDFNMSFLKDKTLSHPEKVRFQNKDGIEIEGYVMKPYDFQNNRKYPGILHIHGGPKTAFGDIFHHEMQLWAAEGYFVFYCNPRGSCGKGNAFADLRGKYGTIDYEDIMEFTDFVTEEYAEWIDKERIGVAGGSYGGFMTNWIIGHTDRFRCAVSQRSIANYFTSFFIADIGYYYVEDQQLGTPWKNPERLWDCSPIKYADKVTTPTLFIHSDQDYRCAFVEGLQMFTALKYFGVETKLCMFYGENHELSRKGKPYNRIKRMEEILNWFKTHL